MGVHRCSQCGSAHLRRSRRRGLAEMAILPLFLIRPYRCAACQKRQYGIGFHRFRRQVSSTVLALVLIAAAMATLVISFYAVMALVTRL